MKANITRKYLARFCKSCAHVKIGYCCYQDAGISKYDLQCIGYNAGVYGWNWSLYYDCKTDTAYISCYRNVPNYIEER